MSTPCSVEEIIIYIDNKNKSINNNFTCNNIMIRRDKQASTADNIKPHQLHNLISITVNNIFSTYAQQMYYKRGNFNGIIRISYARGCKIGNKVIK